MSQCKKCGAALYPNDRFCEKCGAAVLCEIPTYPPNGMYTNIKQPDFSHPFGQKTDPFCIAGLILSWYAGFAVYFAPIFSIAAIVVSAMGLSRVSKSGDIGKNLAIAGIVIGALGLIVFAALCIGILFSIGSYHIFDQLNTMQV